jgi:hypothetical protein
MIHDIALLRLSAPIGVLVEQETFRNKQLSEHELVLCVLRSLRESAIACSLSEVRHVSSTSSFPACVRRYALSLHPPRR